MLVKKFVLVIMGCLSLLSFFVYPMEGLIVAVKNRDIGAVEQVIARGVKDINEHDMPVPLFYGGPRPKGRGRGGSSEGMAVNLRSVRRRVPSSFLDLTPSTEGMTALTIAAMNGDEKIVAKLLEAGADPNIKDMKNEMENDHGNNPLMWAVIKEHGHVVAELLKHPNLDPNIKDDLGNTALMFAASKGDDKIVGALLNHPNIDLNITNNYGVTVLMLVARNGEDKVFDELLKHLDKVDLNIKDNSGNTALMLAANKGDAKIVGELLKHLDRVDPNIKDGSGNTALMLAANKGHDKVIDELLKHLDKVDPNIRDNLGRTALEIALRKVKTSTINALIESQKLNKLAIPENCAYLTFAQDDNGAIRLNLLNALLQNTVIICSSYMLNMLINGDKPEGQFPQSQFFLNLLSSRSLFTNKTGDLCVIIPEIVQDEETLKQRYGFVNLDYVKPNEVVEKIASLTHEVPQNQFDGLIDRFKEIIDTSSPKHPVSFFLEGHGLTNIKIASIPIRFIGKFLNVLDEIGTKFLYIRTCYMAGENLQFTQDTLQKNIEQQRREDILRLIKYQRVPFDEIASSISSDAEMYRFPASVSAAKIPSINYAIVIEAAADIPTSGNGNIQGFFTKLNEFLKRPLWSFGDRFGRSTQKAPSIKDVIGALAVKHEDVLPSIRFPGTNSFFRAVDLGEMEIITWQRINALRTQNLLLNSSVELMRQIGLLKYELDKLNEKKLQIDEHEFAQKELGLNEQIKELQRAAKNQAQIQFNEKIIELEAQQRQLRAELNRVTRGGATMELSELESQRQERALLKEILDIEYSIEKLLQKEITITVRPNIKFVQVFPLDLHDCTFIIQDSSMPKFISKIPGNGQHYIGAIKYASQKTTFEDALQDFIMEGFVKVFGEHRDPASSSKAWFINSLILTVAGQDIVIKKLAIILDPGVPHYKVQYGYKNFDQTYKIIDSYLAVSSKKDHTVTIRSFIDWLYDKLFVFYIPSKEALYEATGGNETSSKSYQKIVEKPEKSTTETAAERFLHDV